MSRHAVWIEGINFSETVYDTEKLSVVRGASRALEAMPVLAVRHFTKKFPKATIIAQGASMAGFVIDGETAAIEAALQSFTSDVLARQGHDPEKVKADTDRCRNQNLEPVLAAPLAHMQFLSAVVADEGNITATIRRAQASVRTAQLRGGATPQLNGGSKPCEFDRRRAAMDTVTYGPRKDNDTSPGDYSEYYFSPMTAARWHFGRLERQQLYLDVGGDDLNFTDDLQTMVNDPPKLRDGEALPVSVGKKIAVFMADGDKFGALIADLERACGGQYDVALAVLAKALRKKMTGLLRRLVEGLQARPGAKVAVKRRRNDWVDALRFEMSRFSPSGTDCVT